MVRNNINYHIVFNGQNGNNSWDINKSIAGAVILWTNYYGAGKHSPNGMDLTFDTNSTSWGRCILNNAIYDYVNYAQQDGISPPPYHLDIAAALSSDLTSSAPLLKNHFNISLFYAYPNAWGILAELAYYDFFVSFPWAIPDLLLRYNKNMSDYNKITAIVWHELTHASQLQGMKHQKGFFWASDYWSQVVYREAKNDVDTGDPYGAKGDPDWQIIALAEGWAYYREWKMANKYLGWSKALNLPIDEGTNISRYFSDRAFPVTYGEMFDDLIRLYRCSNTKIEKALCSYSVSEFKNKLAAFYPQKSAQIKTYIKRYE